jgi:hypothetical protein
MRALREALDIGRKSVDAAAVEARSEEKSAGSQKQGQLLDRGNEMKNGPR